MTVNGYLSFAESMLRAGDTAAGLGAGHGGRTAHEGGEAGAGEAAQGVDTHGVVPAHPRLGRALVHIQTQRPGSSEPGPREKRNDYILQDFCDDIFQVNMSLPAHTLALLALCIVGAVEV